MDLSGLQNGFRLAPQLQGVSGSKMVVDASHVPTKLDPASKLILFPIGAVFSDERAVFIGFGRPNTYLVVPRDGDSPKGKGWDKFAAFMFWRKTSYVADTKGRVQSGVLYELRGLSDATIVKLREEMANHSNMRGASCAHTNSQVLDAAGFTLGGGKRLTHVYRPFKLAILIWRYGLELDGKAVDIRVIQTGDEVFDHFAAVWRRELTSVCRTVQKKFHKPTDDIPAPIFEETFEADPVEPRTILGQQLRIGISRPSWLGARFSFFFGQHPIFVCEPTIPLVAPELAEPLVAYKGKIDQSTSFKDKLIIKLKQRVLFSKLTVWFIRKHLMASIDYYPDFTGDAVIDMLMPSPSPEKEQAFKYNLVMTKKQIFLTRLEDRSEHRLWRWLRRKLNWVLSKHVLIAGYSREVIFPGEVWKYTPAGGSPTVYVTGDSGTYQPKDDRIKPAVQYMASSFAVEVVPVFTRGQQV